MLRCVFFFTLFCALAIIYIKCNYRGYIHYFVVWTFNINVIILCISFCMVFNLVFFLLHSTLIDDWKKILFLAQDACPLRVRELCSLDLGTQAAGAVTVLNIDSFHSIRKASSSGFPTCHRRNNSLAKIRHTVLSNHKRATECNLTVCPESEANWVTANNTNYSNNQENWAAEHTHFPF